MDAALPLMPPLYTLLGALALIAYAIAALLYTAAVFLDRRSLGPFATAGAAMGAIFNLVALWTRGHALHTVPYADILGSLSLFGFFLAALHVVLEIRHGDRALGPFLMPASFLFLLLALVLPPRAAAPGPEMRGSFFALHVTLNMLAYSAFTLAAALSGLYLLASRSLRNLASGGATASRLPSLSFLVGATRTSLSVGVATQLLGLGFGVAWAVQVWNPGSRWLLDPKVLLAFATFGFYAVVAFRAHRGAAPVTTARLALAGLVLLALSLSSNALSRVHGFDRFPPVARAERS